MIVTSYFYRKHTHRPKWKKNGSEWRGGGWCQIFFSHGSSISRGVATLFPPNSDYKILEKYSDINGRFLLLKCKCEEAIYVIVNCYNNLKKTK